MKWRTALELGRVSNLPTVWSNCLAGAVLGGASWHTPALLVVAVAVSLMYLGGMFLNDAFDADWDAQHKPERPIVRGAASRQEVWTTGGILLAAGPLVMLSLHLFSEGRDNTLALAGSLLLAVAILAYDRVHKRVAYSPWLMGACRLLVYATAGLATGEMTPLLAAGGLALMAYIVGVTYAARAEHLNDPGSWWPLLLLASPALLAASLVPARPESVAVLGILLFWLMLRSRDLLPGPRQNVPAAVGGLLAGISLIDASLLAGSGAWVPAGLALAAFAATLSLQRSIAGT